MHFLENFASLISDVQKYQFESVWGYGFGASNGVVCRGYDELDSNAVDSVTGQYTRILVCQ